MFHNTIKPSRRKPDSEIDHSLGMLTETEGKIISQKSGGIRKKTLRNKNDRTYLISDKPNIEAEEDKPQRTRPKPLPESFDFLGVGSKDPGDDINGVNKWLETTSGFIEANCKLAGENGMEPVVLSDTQSALLDYEGRFSLVRKCRQWGYSFGISCRGLKKAISSNNRHISIFTSFNEEDAQEKILNAKELYESLPLKYRLARKIKYSTKSAIVFAKQGPNSAETRLLSHPQRPIRGKGGYVDIYLDELGHYHFDKLIYASVVPILSRGKGGLHIGSTPFGKQGVYWEIAEQELKPYPHYMRMKVPWYIVSFLCKDVEAAKKDAYFMGTEERVYKYANQNLIEIYESMGIEDFQQEYELVYVDESIAFFSYDLLKDCTPIFDYDGSNAPDFDDDLEDDGYEGGKGIKYYNDFEEFQSAIKSGIITGRLLGGFDVGRKQDAGEFFFLEEDDNGMQKIRFNHRFKNVPFREQKETVSRFVNGVGLKLFKVGMDATSIGMQLKEDLDELHPGVFESLPFGDARWKDRVCHRMKVRLQDRYIQLPVDRSVFSQFHSIKRTLTTANNFRFDTSRNEKHHADKYWSIVCASEMSDIDIRGNNGIGDLIHEDMDDVSKKAREDVRFINDRFFKTNGSMFAGVQGFGKSSMMSYKAGLIHPNSFMYNRRMPK